MCSPRSPRSATVTLEPRGEEEIAAAELMVRPEPVVESSAESMTEAAWAFLEPTRSVFPNGATVIYNVTDITDGDVSFGGRSLGGSSLLADADVVDAVLAGEVVTSSGVGDLGPVELDRYLADADVFVTGVDRPVHGGPVRSRRDARPRGPVPARAPSR